MADPIIPDDEAARKREERRARKAADDKRRRMLKKTEIRAHQNQWIEANRDKINAKRRAKYSANPNIPHREKISPEQRRSRRREYERAYEAANRERINEQKRERYAINPEIAKAHKKRYLAKPEAKIWMSEYNKAWLAKNRAHKAAYWKSYYTKNRDELREKGNKKNAEIRGRPEYKEKFRPYLKVWTTKNPEKIKVYRQKREARERGAVGHFTPEDVARIRKNQRDKCAYCRSPLNGKGHLDHIVAIARGGSNYPRNLQLTCQSCNQRKSAKNPIDFAQEIGLLL